MRLTSFDLSRTVIQSNATSVTGITATVTLSETAPATGTIVMLGSSSSVLKVPAEVVVPAGQTTATFVIGSGTLLPSVDYYVWAQVKETVFRRKVRYSVPGIESAVFSPATVQGGLTTRLTVTLASIASGSGALIRLTEILNYQGEVVPLITDLPPSLVIAAGDLSAYVDVTTRVWDAGRLPPPREVLTAVDATYGDGTLRAILIVTDP